jgi:hypothetical protein
VGGLFLFGNKASVTIYSEGRQGNTHTGDLLLEVSESARIWGVLSNQAESDVAKPVVIRAALISGGAIYYHRSRCRGVFGDVRAFSLSADNHRT